MPPREHLCRRPCRKRWCMPCTDSRAGTPHMLPVVGLFCLKQGLGWRTLPSCWSWTWVRPFPVRPLLYLRKTSPACREIAEELCAATTECASSCSLENEPVIGSLYARAARVFMDSESTPLRVPCRDPQLNAMPNDFRRARIAAWMRMSGRQGKN